MCLSEVASEAFPVSPSTLAILEQFFGERPFLVSIAVFDVRRFARALKRSQLTCGDVTLSQGLLGIALGFFLTQRRGKATKTQFPGGETASSAEKRKRPQKGPGVE